MMRAIWPWLIFGEALSVAVLAWSLYERWNSPWWVFIPKAITLALVCGAATVVVVIMWRLFHRLEHTEP